MNIVEDLERSLERTKSLKEASYLEDNEKNEEKTVKR